MKKDTHCDTWSCEKKTEKGKNLVGHDTADYNILQFKIICILAAPSNYSTQRGTLHSNHIVKGRKFPSGLR